MSLIPHSFFPRSAFDMDMWMQPSHLPSTLDLFDPFDEFDRMIGRNFQWLNRPESLFESMLAPRVPHKYRINVDCHGFSSDSIKIDVSDDKKKLVVSAREGEPGKNQNEDYTLREFKRTYNLPKHADPDQMASFLTSNGQLVIEVPLKEDEHHKRKAEDLLPRIVDGENNTKRVEMNFSLPEGIDPSKVKVTCKDRDIVVQAEDKQERPDMYSQTSYYRRCTLPENTNFDALKCVFDKNKLALTAPLNMDYRSNQRQIPIEHKQAIENKKK